MTIQSLTPKELVLWYDSGKEFFLLDVRTDEEVALASLPKHHHIPMPLVPIHLDNIPDEIPIVVYCHHGIRSFQVASYLDQAGFEEVYNLTGGIDAWSLTVDSRVPRY